MSRVVLVAVIAAALLAALAPLGAQEPAAQPRITEIVISGNAHVPADQITPAITSKVGEVYSPEQAAKDRDAILALGWFYPVEVSTEPTPEGVRLIFRVQEKMVVQNIVFEGNTVFTAQQLLAVMQTKPGQVLNDVVLNRDLDAIIKKYTDAGYTVVQILGKPTADEQTGTLTIRIAEGRISAIEVVGNRKTKKYVITRELQTKVGMVWNTRTIERDLRRLLNTDLFADVTATPALGARPGEVILRIRVQEKKTGLASVGVAYSSVQKLVGFADVAEANLAGTGQRVSLRGEFGGRNSYELGYFNPWINPAHTSLGVNLYNKTILREAFAEKSILYDEKRTGGNITLSRPLSENTRVYGTLRADSVSARSRDQNEPLPPDVVLRQGANVRSIGATLVNDTRDLIFDPSRGGYNSVSLEVAGLLGGSRFNKFGGDLRRYWKVGGKPGKARVFASRILAGFITGSPPALEQFLVGGGETLRGYPNDRFPGRNMVVMNNEYRFPLGSKLSGVVFVDIGDAWGGAFAEEFGDPSFKLHVGYGVGVRVGTPIGNIRLDFGIGSEGTETHFSVGQAF